MSPNPQASTVNWPAWRRRPSVVAGQYTLLQAQQRDRAGILARPDEGIDPMWITHFAVPDAAAAAQRAKALGGEILLDASPEFRESSLALVTDPMGAILALHQWPEAGESQ